MINVLISAQTCAFIGSKTCVYSLPNSLPPYLLLVALLQSSQVADETHGKTAPLFSFGVLGQAVQQYPRVPGLSQQPQGLHLWEVIWLQKSRKMFKRPFNAGHLADSLDKVVFSGVKQRVNFSSNPVLFLLTFTNAAKGRGGKKNMNQIILFISFRSPPPQHFNLVPLLWSKELNSFQVRTPSERGNMHGLKSSVMSQ